METIKNIFQSITDSISKPFYFLGTLGSIIGAVIILFNEEWAVITALSFFCIMLLIFTSYFIYSIFRILEIRNNEYNNKSTFIKYENLDGNKIVYETYKLIQSKKPVLTEFEYNFQWTGTHMPEIISNLQKVEHVIDEQDPTKYDKAILKFNSPLYYNQDSIIHFKAELDDTDNQSKPWVETKVDKEIDIIHYRIILKNKISEYNENATLKRVKINSATNPDYEIIREIPFDRITKSYEYHLLKPDVGYFYKIEWA